ALPVGRLLGARGAATSDDGEVADLAWTPPEGDPTELRILERVGEEVGKSRREAGVAAFGFGTDRVKIHEPGLEQRPRHCLQRLAHLPAQLDLFVEGAENASDGALRTVVRDPDLFLVGKIRELEIAYAGGLLLVEALATAAVHLLQRVIGVPGAGNGFVDADEAAEACRNYRAPECFEKGRRDKKGSPGRLFASAAPAGDLKKDVART